MNAYTLVVSTLLALSITPAFAQHSHGGNPGRTGRGSAPDHSSHQDGPPKVNATNSVCPVMGREVKSGRDREVVIRGNYYLVCCDGCGPDMSEHYEKYLDKDGRPLNDPKRNSKADPKSDPKDAGKPAPAPSSQEGHQH